MKDKGYDFDEPRHPPQNDTLQCLCLILLIALEVSGWRQDLQPADHLAIKPRSKKAANSQFRAFLSDTALAQKSVAKEQINPSPFPKIQSNFHFQKAPACCFAASSPDVFPACGQKDV